MKRNLNPNVSFTCEACGKHVEKYVEPFKQRSGVYTQQYCDRTCAGVGRRGKGHFNWAGGRVILKDGYVLVYCPDHPTVVNRRRKYVYEHRLKMERKLGRFLKPGEVVHHKNGNTQDNRLSNLLLCESQADHKRIHESGRTRNAKGQYT